VFIISSKLFANSCNKTWSIFKRFSGIEFLNKFQSKDKHFILKLKNLQCFVIILGPHATCQYRLSWHVKFSIFKIIFRRLRLNFSAPDQSWGKHFRENVGRNCSFFGFFRWFCIAQDYVAKQFKHQLYNVTFISFTTKNTNSGVCCRGPVRACERHNTPSVKKMCLAAVLKHTYMELHGLLHSHSLSGSALVSLSLTMYARYVYVHARVCIYIWQNYWFSAKMVICKTSLSRWPLSKIASARAMDKRPAGREQPSSPWIFIM
jgi:hypothetical protein